VRPAACSIAACAVVFSAHSASAHPDSIAIDISATIPARCGFATSTPEAVSSTRDLELAANLSLRLGLDCNAPYALGVVAERGTLVNRDAAPDGSGYAFEKDYRVSVVLETDRGLVRSERCGSRDLTPGGACSFAATQAGEGLKSGRGISINRDAILKIEWPDQSPSAPRLAAGRYRDTLILIVGARA
jgi:hypothetical protein